MAAKRHKRHKQEVQFNPFVPLVPFVALLFLRRAGRRCGNRVLAVELGNECARNVDAFRGVQ